ncbi:MAG: type II toxin-antitoxin system PemK/MazF family toxin [Desulfitobacterium hafniense]|nr:type II toxin-antitoxin system PemK/MazF family toxin [Desulfitobacterium hafniense]
MYDFSLGEIYWIEVGYEYSTEESKVRPAIIVSEEDGALLILVTTKSVPPHDPPKYYDQFKIPILNWRKAGLLKPSWAQGSKLIRLMKEDLSKLVKRDDFIGRMPELDFNFLVAEIERIQNNRWTSCLGVYFFFEGPNQNKGNYHAEYQRDGIDPLRNGHFA